MLQEVDSECALMVASEVGSHQVSQREECPQLLFACDAGLWHAFSFDRGAVATVLRRHCKSGAVA